jgi:hypothetical protein
MGPDSFVLWILRELSHEFAFSSESVEFLRGIHRQTSLRGLWDVRAKPLRDHVLKGPRVGCHAETNRYGHSDAVCGTETRQEALGSGQLVSSVAEG